jgi:hypothetical protein
MKKLTMLLLLVSSLQVLAIEDNFKVAKGSLHTGGKLHVRILESQDVGENMFADIGYELYGKLILPVPNSFLKGTHRQELPKMFRDETGFIELERMKKIVVKEADIIHMGKFSYNGYTNCHKVQIRAHNQKSVMEVIYHRSAPKTGWLKLNMTIYKIPVLESYSLTGTRADQ